VVQLDSDMMLRRNMDELMDLALDVEGDRVFAASHACVCNPLKKAHYPKDWYCTHLLPHAWKDTPPITTHKLTS